MKLLRSLNFHCLLLRAAAWARRVFGRPWNQNVIFFIYITSSGMVLGSSAERKSLTYALEDSLCHSCSLWLPLYLNIRMCNTRPGLLLSHFAKVLFFRISMRRLAFAFYSLHLVVVLLIVPMLILLSLVVLVDSQFLDDWLGSVLRRMSLRSQCSRYNLLFRLQEQVGFAFRGWQADHGVWPASKIVIILNSGLHREVAILWVFVRLDCLKCVD